MELTYHESAEIPDTKYIATSSGKYTQPAGIKIFTDNNLMLILLLPDDVRVNIIIDDIRLRSILTTNKTIKVTKNLFSIRYLKGLLNRTQEF